MINELYELARVLDDAQVKRQSWHPKYKPIPNIRQNAPCVRIMVSGGKIADISSVSAELGKSIRKYGDNQGTYPCMNLAPLYRITDESVKKELADLKKHPEKIDTACICKMKTWCTAAPAPSACMALDECSVRRMELLLGAGFRFAGPVLGTPTVIRTLYAPTGDRGAGPT